MQHSPLSLVHLRDLTPLGPPGTPDQGLSAEAVSPAGLGKEKFSQWHYFPHPDGPEDIAEQTQSAETLMFLQMFLPSRDFSFPQQLGPCHPQNCLLLLQMWHDLIAFLPPTLPQSVPTNFWSLPCGCLCPSQIPPAQGTQFHIFGPIKTPSTVLGAIEKLHSLSAARVIGQGAVQDAGDKLVSAFLRLLCHVLSLSCPLPISPLIHFHCSRWGYILFTPFISVVCLCGLKI